MTPDKESVKTYSLGHPRTVGKVRDIKTVKASKMINHLKRN